MCLSKSKQYLSCQSATFKVNSKSTDNDYFRVKQKHGFHKITDYCNARSQALATSVTTTKSSPTLIWSTKTCSSSLAAIPQTVCHSCKYSCCSL